MNILPTIYPGTSYSTKKPHHTMNVISKMESSCKKFWVSVWVLTSTAFFCRKVYVDVKVRKKVKINFDSWNCLSHTHSWAPYLMGKIILFREKFYNICMHDSFSIWNSHWRHFHQFSFSILSSCEGAWLLSSKMGGKLESNGTDVNFSLQWRTIFQARKLRY